jgi:glucosamine--fructose-6-phosphate aminotransferase (isomerizing)
MYLLALRLAELRGTMKPETRRRILAQFRSVPSCIQQVVASAEADVEEIAEKFADSEFFLYIGRNVGVPVALEGALKLKEISYISTDAYAAGEMKHGPIALLSERTPVVSIATDSPVLDKVISNMQEVRARGASVIAVASRGNTQIGAHADYVLTVPELDWMLQPLLAVIPLQVLAYAIARKRGLNVDQPRNLAKTVTVE